jgi:FMN-dependent NADH-azoreductase
LSEELLASDLLVISTPMWNFGIPSHLKVAALSVGAGKAVENRGFRGFEVGQSQDRLRASAFFFTTTGSLHDLWSPIATG